ncbi:hypothetical protein GGX14DRAFT_676208 [Mycena pura]|uniref:Uncharacterized protein n=1 Tax=Mycena pura TaxID=153505 RepID=A0AAD6YKL2_9AGAR|nr:hypothetical protein GGX14DRAFT_676208 [Mycena pura]
MTTSSFSHAFKFDTWSMKYREEINQGTWIFAPELSEKLSAPLRPMSPKSQTLDSTPLRQPSHALPAVPDQFPLTQHQNHSFEMGNRDEMPLHWKDPTQYVWPRQLRSVLKPVFTVLCIVAFGHKIAHSNYEAFAKDTDRISRRISQISTVVSLLLASISALVTTVPPRDEILNYTLRGPYLCMWASFGILLGGVIVASADVYGLATCTPQLAIKMMGTRMRIWSVLIMLAYPFFSVGVGVSVCVLGLLAAAWCSEDLIVKNGCVFLLLVPASLILVFLVTLRESPLQPEDGSKLNRADESGRSNEEQPSRAATSSTMQTPV